MRIQKKVIDSKTPINTDGSFQTKEDRRISYLKQLDSNGEPKQIISPHPDSKIFDKYLLNYQEDINKIVGKFRYDSHQLSHSEVVSEVNLSLIRKRDEILTDFHGEFAETNFKKLAYRFVRNVIKWTQWRIVHSSYVDKRIDSEHFTEDGYKTTYELAVETNGEEESFFEDYDRNEKCSYLMKVIRDYSSLFTDKEIKVLSFLKAGATQYEIAEKLNVTHQAVSLMSIKIFDKIKAHFKSKVIEDNSFTDVSKGHQSISDFFKRDPKTSPLEDEDKPALKKFLLQNAKAYDCNKVSEIFMNGKYNNRQISSFASKNKLSFCLIKKRAGYKFSEEESSQVLSLLKKGETCKKVSSIMGIPVNSIIGKKANLVRKGLLSYSSNEAME